MCIVTEVSEYIRSPSKSVDSLFIACASFEERSRGVTGLLSDEYSTRNAVLFFAEEYSDKGMTPENISFLENRLKSLSTGDFLYQPFSIDGSLNPMERFEGICRDISDKERSEYLTIDITTFPRQELFIVLRILEKYFDSGKIRIYYAEPGQYATEVLDKDGNPGWLTRGVSAVNSVPGFGGIQPPGKGSLLLLFLGHEAERTIITWKRHQPDEKIIVSSSEHYRKELEGIPERLHELTLSVLGSDTEHIKIPARGVREAKEVVLKIYKRYSKKYSIFVAPYGTKLQAFGIYKAASLEKDIQITYAVPSVYNYEDYSVGIGRIWEIKRQ